MSKTGGKNCPQTGKWESKEFRASQGRKNHSAVSPAPEKGMEKADQAERRSCLAERYLFIPHAAVDVLHFVWYNEAKGAPVWCR